MWNPRQKEWLVCKKDNRQEALEHGPNAVGVYKESSEESSLASVGHVPIELSRLVNGFLGASEKHSVSVQVCGKRKREVGLIVLGLYCDFSLEQDIIFKPDLKKRDTQKPNDMTRTNIKEDICHFDFVYRYAFCQCTK